LLSLTAGVAVTASLFSTQPTVAQDASTYYTVQHPEQFKTDWAGFYRQADAATAAVRATTRHTLDLPYGSDVKQRLDLYFPATTTSAAPVFLFFHGGGFREGDRAQYGFIAKSFTAHGIIAAVASYRLTGAGFIYPAQRDDAAQAMIWVYKNIGRLGGDPGRIYLGGHSSGAIMVAELGADRTWLRKASIAPRALRGIVAVSAPYDLRTPEEPEAKEVFWSGYVPTARLRGIASPMLHIVDPVPVFYVVAGANENRGYDDYASSSRMFVDRLRGRGVKARVLIVPGAGHRDTVQGLGDDHSELFKGVLEMINAG
jgi:acetyl esterase/lipase